MSRTPQNRSDPLKKPSRESTPSPRAGTPADRPFGVYVITTVVGLEALALAAAGIWFLISAFGPIATSMASVVFLIVLTFALAAFLAAVSVNAYKGMRWTRSAAFVWQLLMVSLAIPVLTGGAVWAGLAMLVPAVAAACFLFTPKVVAFSLRTTSETPAL